MKSTENAIRILQSNHIRPSHHRIQILAYLLKNRNHPTVDRLYRDLLPSIPTLSKTTLYNTLNLLAEKGLVALVTIEENEIRYDADTSLHGHFKCTVCGKVYDIGLHLDSLDFAELNGFSVNNVQVLFQGICPQCQDAAAPDECLQPETRLEKTRPTHPEKEKED